MADLKATGVLPESVELRQRMLQGYEVMNMIRKGQVHGVWKGDIKDQVTFIASLFGVAA
jgi:IS6 family transposase